MKIETERKFIIKDRDAALSGIYKNISIKQGYFDILIPSFRIRLMDYNKAFITLKKRIRKGKCYEFEYEIPYQDGVMLYDMCKYKVEKIRYYKRESKLLWELDYFTNLDLFIAEIETTKKITLPKWIGKEVTKDDKYTNINLAKHGIL